MAGVCVCGWPGSVAGPERYPSISWVCIYEFVDLRVQLPWRCFHGEQRLFPNERLGGGEHSRSADGMSHHRHNMRSEGKAYWQPQWLFECCHVCKMALA